MTAQHQVVKIFLQRTAGPYIRVIFDRVIELSYEWMSASPPKATKVARPCNMSRRAKS